MNQQVGTEEQRRDLAALEPLARKKAERAARQLARGLSKKRKNYTARKAMVLFVSEGQEAHPCYSTVGHDQWSLKLHFAHMVKNICQEILRDQYGLTGQISLQIEWVLIPLMRDRVVMKAEHVAR